MYSASNAFHNAVKNGAHQIALLIFDDAVFSNEDINVTKGIEFNDYFCTEENLAIGQALSNEISFTLFNDHGYLNDYAFGDFTALIGVKINEEFINYSFYTQTNAVAKEWQGYTWDGRSYPNQYLLTTRPYTIERPDFPVFSILNYGGNIYAFGSNGQCKVYKETDGTTVEPFALNDFMKHKVAKWAGIGYMYSKVYRKLRKYTIVYVGTQKKLFMQEYEFVPLGIFTAERPDVPNKIEVNFHCYDLMQKFEKDMPDDATLGITYPCTFRDLFKKMCDHVGVSYVSSTFLNSTATISTRPDAFNSVTMREVLGWIAEAAGSVARFDRDGKLKMDWIRTTSLEIDENGYSEFDPYWYKTKTVTKLCNRASNGDYDIYSGNGNEAYLIQDNPLLKGVN